MLAKTTSCRLSDNCHPQAALPPVNTAKSGRCVIYSCGPKAQRRRVSSRAGALLVFIPNCLPGPGHRKSCCWDQPDVCLRLSSCCIDHTILPLKVSVSQQRYALGKVKADSDAWSSRGQHTHASARGVLTLLVLPSPSWGSGLPGASFSLLFSPEESQLSHSFPVSHSGGRTESETSADAQGFQLPQTTGPGR